MMLENIEKWAELYPVIVNGLTFIVNIGITLGITLYKQKKSDEKNQQLLKRDLEKHRTELELKYVADKNISNLRESLDILAEYIALAQQIANYTVSKEGSSDHIVFTNLPENIAIQLNLDLAKLKLRFDSAKEKENTIIFLIQLICNNASKGESEFPEDRFSPNLHKLTIEALTKTAQIYYSIEKEKMLSVFEQNKDHLDNLETAFKSTVKKYLEGMKNAGLENYVKPLKENYKL